MSTLIIAEAGVNHNADLRRAIELVDVAVDCGVDIVKFQTAVPEEVVTEKAEMAEYQKNALGVIESQLEMTRRIHLPFDAFYDIKQYCDKRNIEFLTTSFGPQSTDFVSTLGLSRLKIPSGEITNLPYLRHIGSMGKPVIMSTGMATLDEVQAAMVVLLGAGCRKDDLTILHCTTEYPSPMVDVNLRAMLTMRDELGVKVGYSDHTIGIEVPIAAVAMGACVIEKHFTLDRNLPGPDHAASLEPEELKAMVLAIRNIEQAMGDGVKRVSPSEAKNRPIARKSIVAAKPISIGEPFTLQNVTVKRPGTGISPMRWDEIMSSNASRNFAVDELIEI